MGRLRKLQLLFLIIACQQSIGICDALMEKCLANPYVTSVRGLHVRKDSSKYYLTFELQLNYKHNYILSNITYDEASTSFNNSDARFHLADDDGCGTDVCWRQDTVNGKRTRFTKEGYLRRLDRWYITNQLDTRKASPSEVATDCSDVHIFDADYFAPLANSKKVIHVIYRYNVRCFAVLDDETEESQIAAHYQPDNRSFTDTTLPTNVISATYNYPFKFEFTANGRVIYTVYSESTKPSLERPLGIGNQNDLYITHTIGIGEQRQFVPSAHCKDLIRHYEAKLSPASRYEHTLPYPIRSASEFKLHPVLHHTFLRYDPQFIDKKSLFYDLIDLPFSSYVKAPENHPHMKFYINSLNGGARLEKLARYSDSPGNSTLFFRDLSTQKYFQNGFFTQNSLSSTILPDDVYYLRYINFPFVASIYGLAFVMHPPQTDIITQNGTWKRYNPQTFSAPILAAFSNNDAQVIFISHRTRATIVEFDGSHENGRIISQIGTLRSISRDPEEPLFVEYTAFDFIETLKLPPVTWVSISLGVIVLLSMLIVLSIFLYKFSTKESGEVVYSRTRLSAIEVGSSKAPANNDYDPSTAPLFQESKEHQDAKLVAKRPAKKTSKSSKSRLNSPKRSSKLLKSVRSPLVTRTKRP